MPLPPLSEVVDRAVEQDERRFDKLLSALYADPASARTEFSSRIATVGAQRAGRQMADDPRAFGELHANAGPERVRDLAREAGFIGAISHLLQNERDPETVAGLMTERFFQGACTVFEDAGQMFKSWRHAVETDGASAAARRLATEPEFFGALRPDAARYTRALGVRGVDAEVARAHSTHRTEHETGNRAERRMLPRSAEEVAHRDLPRPLEVRLEALSASFRSMLARAYQDPSHAEATFHEISGEKGLQATVLAVRRDPTILGATLDARDAGNRAYAAVQRGARAYELDAISNPAEAAEALRRESERSLARQIANPREALLTVQAAMRHRGVEAVVGEIGRNPDRHFTPTEGQTLNPALLARVAGYLGATNRVADGYLEDEARSQHSGRRATPTPAEATATATLEAHAKATRLATRKGNLHVALNNAANAARRAESADKWLGIYRTQLRRMLGTIYTNPAAAEVEFLRVADEKTPSGNSAEDAEAAKRRRYAVAIDQLTKKPQSLGRLAPDKRAAKEAARSSGDTAFSFLDARDKSNALEWRDAEGKVHRGVEDVRSETTKVLGASAAELATTERQIKETGSKEETKARAVEAVQALPPAKADELIRALKARDPDGGPSYDSVRETAASRREPMIPPGAAHNVLQTVQTVRTLGEGPTM